MRILLTGLCTLHHGRLEFGNIGNYYITEATIRELHRVFPGAEIRTTFQLTRAFLDAERVIPLPMDLFYQWQPTDVSAAQSEHEAVRRHLQAGAPLKRTPYIEEVMRSDLVVNLSGEMWGDHAEPVGRGRFITSLLKDRTAQLLGKPVALMAGSQGPFQLVEASLDFAREVFKHYVFVGNREAASLELLKRHNFDVSRARAFADVAFLFEGTPPERIQELLRRDQIISPTRPTVGFILSGFNMERGPYDAEPRSDVEFMRFVELVEFIISATGARVLLLSHQNGFVRNPRIEMVHGRDYPYAESLHRIIVERGKVPEDCIVLTRGPYDPRDTKAIIGALDLLVTGRIHAFVAAVSQSVPAVVISRGHGGVSHRNIGFAQSVGLEHLVADPNSTNDMIEKVRLAWDSRHMLSAELRERMPAVKSRARAMFETLQTFVPQQ